MNTGLFGQGATRAHGVSGWLEPGVYEDAERFLAQCRAQRAAWVRLAITVDQWHDPGGRAWLHWLASRLVGPFELVVALYRRPPPPSGPPASVSVGDVLDYRRVVETLGGELSEYGHWLELADVLGPPVWPDTSLASATLLRTLHLPDRVGLCIGGLPLDAKWVSAAWAQGVLAPASALAFSHHRPGEPIASQLPGLTGDSAVEYAPQIWLTPERLAPGPVADGRMAASLRDCAAYLDAAAHRFFLPLRPPPVSGLRAAAGLEAGGEALAARLLADERGPGLAHVARMADAGEGSGREDLVVGGAGFIGCNLAARLAGAGRDVLILDDLSRPGTEHNLEWLCRRFPGRIRTLLADIRDEAAVRHAVSRAGRVFHFAAQVAVTTSLVHPFEDLQINASGTLNLLEAIRRRDEPPPLLFTSTNKVYGGLEDIPLRLGDTGYEPLDAAIRRCGIDESRPLTLCSPYGCSKGAAEQYVLDYARGFGLPTVVLRMSCIYGPRQFGNEDQGWVAHFVRSAITGTPLTVYGDGFQVRDVLFVDDLIDAAELAMARLPATAGEAFNIGGGSDRVLSLDRLLRLLESLTGRGLDVRSEDWRPADQRYYVSDTGKFRRATGWQPRVEVEDGVGRLYDWMQRQLRESPGEQRQGQVAV